MSTMFDIHLTPIARYSGQEYPELIGVYASEPPRRSARSRDADRLVFYLALAGNLPAAPDKKEEILANAARVFYNSPGSVTSAMRAAADELNKIIIEWNRIGAESGRQAIGLFAQLVLRGDQMYLAHSGALHSYLVTESGVQKIIDVEPSAKGLGVTRSAPLNFSQINCQPNSSLFVAGLPDPGWNGKALYGLHSQGPESIRRRLASQSFADMNVLVVQVRPGKGKIHILQARPTAGKAPPPDFDLAPGQEQENVEKEEQQQSSAGETVIPVHPVPIGAPKRIPAEVPKKEIVAEKPIGKRPARLGVGFAPAGSALAKGARRVVGSLGSLLGRIFPHDLFQTVPSTIMASIALIVPVVVVTVASVAYFRLGTSVQYEISYSQALETAERAVQQTSMLEQRAGWVSVLALLDQAERYQKSNDTVALRAQAQYSLDTIDQIKRLDYKPAIMGGLRPDVKVIRMAVSVDDLYMLDGNSGKVLRAQPTNQGYQLDSSFECGPASAGSNSVGPLIDIIAWPTTYEPKAAILGIDQTGNLAFCQPNKDVVIIRLAMPEAATSEIKAVSLNLADLYIKNQNSRTVWIFRLGTYDKAPRQYFADESEKPANLDSTQAIIADRDDLYLLHDDGKLTFCFTENVPSVPVRCQDGKFVDMRPGRENLPMTFETPLEQVLLSSSPDSSLYFLEPATRAIYQFSLRSMVFQRHYLPQEDLSMLPATAFAIYPPRRSMFLAIGNEVFHAALP